jgi:5-methyltetrahydropteroyltriglutamate--homocysteine methyltransferase
MPLAHILGFPRIGSRRELKVALEAWTLIGELQAAGVDWVQIDEPILSLDLPKEWLDAYPWVYGELATAGPPVLLASYFGGVAEKASMLKELPIAGLHLDLVRAPQQLAEFMSNWPEAKVLSLGVVDGRNLWRTNLAKVLSVLRPVYEVLGDRLWISTSCSLLHVPTDLSLEENLDPEIRSWMAFATQKLNEIGTLKRALSEGESAVRGELQAAGAAVQSRRLSPATCRAHVRADVAALTDKSAQRGAAFAERIGRQRDVLKLPPLPTTTIGSFPQTAAIRTARAAYKRGTASWVEYEASMKGAIRETVLKQESLGLDVLVHGEAERNAWSSTSANCSTATSLRRTAGSKATARAA